MLRSYFCGDYRPHEPHIWSLDNLSCRGHKSVADSPKEEIKEKVEAMSEKLHPSFQKLHDSFGSGYYYYATRLGLGSIFYLSSTVVVPYNPPQQKATSPHHDFYDALRAVETGYVNKLENGPAWSRGKPFERETN